jgi:hypothetical protein
VLRWQQQLDGPGLHGLWNDVVEPVRMKAPRNDPNFVSEVKHDGF